jgi:hypothetical protein
VMPAQGTPERTSEIGVEEEVIHMNGAEGVHSEDTSPHTRFTVLECGLASSFSIAFKKKILRNTRLKQPELIRLAGCRAPEFLPGYWQT